MTRFTRTCMLALTAAVAFGIAGFASTEASAHHWGKPHWGKPWHKPHWHKPYYPHHGHWRRPIYVVAPVAAAPAYRPARPVQQAQPAMTNPSACLTKEYSPDGYVVFKDRCTNEMAVAQVPGVQQQSGANPQNFAGGNFQQPQAPLPQSEPAPQNQPK